MAQPLKVEYWHDARPGIRTMRISRFGDGELNELKSMEHKEATDVILNLLDRRNQGLGTQWKCGYGVWGMWFDNEYAYMNIGSNCD